MKHKQVEATISHDKTSNRYVVSITDKASGEVIRQVPSEAIQQFARNLEGLKGVLFDAML
jgi:flagellar protein FlaG